MSRSLWASDVAISMPEPLDSKTQGLVPMFGFVFTANGLFHDIDQTDHDEISTPSFSPVSPADTVYDDLNVEDDSPGSEF